MSSSAVSSQRAPGWLVVAATFVSLVLVAALILYALWAFWPTKASLAPTAGQPAAATASATAGGTAAATPAGACRTRPGSKCVHFFGLRRLISTEILFFLIVALAGALGALIHTMRSFSWYVGHRGLKWRWLPYYLGLPALGAGCGTIFYLVLRGGLFAAQASTGDVNPYSFAAVGALVGLFTEQALEMLRRVANQIFSEAPQGEDTAGEGGEQAPAEAPPAPAPVVATGAAADVGPTTAALAGTVDPQGQPTTYRFEYGPTTDYGQQTDEQTLDGTAGETAVNASVAELTPSTDYHYRLVAQSPAGTAQGEDATFTTTAG